MMTMAEALERANVSFNNVSEKVIPIVVSYKETLMKKAKNGEVLKKDELVDLGCKDKSTTILQSAVKRDVEFIFYGGELVEILVCGKEVEKIFDIPECDGIDSSLEYRISNDILIDIYRRCGIIK